MRGNIQLKNSVILGDSDNMGKPVVDANGTVISDRSLPAMFMKKL